VQKIWLIVFGVVIVAGISLAAFFGLRDDAGPGSIATTTAPSGGGSGDAVKPGDRVLGDPDAPITVIEYSSLTCPHCATFHAVGLPHLTSQYIDKGLVKLVMRDFPLDEAAAHAATLARCVAPERYFPFIALLFESQATWARANDPVAALTRVASMGGLGADKVRTCLSDQAIADSVLAERLEGQNTYDIGSTPTFVVNGQKYPGALSPDQLDEILKPLLP
jgi:protein-disulfide isomerase